MSNLVGDSMFIELCPSNQDRYNRHNEDGHNENGRRRDGNRTATGALGIRDPLKRTAGDAGLNEGGKGVPGSGKARRKGQSAGPGCSMPRLMVPERPYR